jgi:hypothetical protein
MPVGATPQPRGTPLGLFLLWAEQSLTGSKRPSCRSPLIAARRNEAARRFVAPGGHYVRSSVG